MMMGFFNWLVESGAGSNWSESGGLQFFHLQEIMMFCCKI
jgi:hypothetical protein